jgi:hypothetical protein
MLSPQQGHIDSGGSFRKEQHDDSLDIARAEGEGMIGAPEPPPEDVVREEETLG